VEDTPSNDSANSKDENNTDSDLFDTDDERIKYPKVEEPKIDLSAFANKPKPKQSKPDRPATSGVRINLSDNDDLDSQFEKVK
jgi:hypothetical protein